MYKELNTDELYEVFHKTAMDLSYLNAGRALVGKLRHPPVTLVKLHTKKSVKNIKTVVWIFLKGII